MVTVPRPKGGWGRARLDSDDVGRDDVLRVDALQNEVGFVHDGPGDRARSDERGQFLR